MAQQEGSEIEEAANSDTESEEERELSPEPGHEEGKEADHSGMECSTYFTNTKHKTQKETNKEINQLIIK